MPDQRAHDQWRFLLALARADPTLGVGFWIVLVLRGLLPALFAIVMGQLIGAIERGDPLAPPLVQVGVVFVLLQMLGPIHRAMSANLGSKMATWLYDQLATTCVKPPGMAHLENPRLKSDLTMARDFDLGITMPPLAIGMDFIASGLVEMVGGLASAAVLFGYSAWAPPLLAGAWLATHFLLKESAVWRDRNTEEVREAQLHADYAYRLAVDAPAAKELRLFGLPNWVVERFSTRRRRLHDLRWAATRLRERSVISSLVLVLGANGIVFWSMGADAMNGSLMLGELVTYASAAVGASMVAFGGLSFALDGAAETFGATTRLEAAMAPVGELPSGGAPAAGMPSRDLRFRDVTFTYPTAEYPVLQGFDLTIPAGSSLAIVGQNGAGKTTVAKLLCRLYDPDRGAIEADGTDIKDLDLASWRSRLTAVFQDFIRLELPLRDNVAPGGAPDEAVMAALAQAGATGLAELDTILARGYEGGTELSGGQWQRVALARALCAVHMGAGVVLLDEPTAQLDVRGEAEIFDRILEATQGLTTILVSHRFSTVRHADRICVLEQGRVMELGTHDELIARQGRYCEMFELQASRFAEGGDDPQPEQTDVLS